MLLWEGAKVRILTIEIFFMFSMYITVYYLDMCKNWNLLFNPFGVLPSKQKKDFMDNAEFSDRNGD